MQQSRLNRPKATIFIRATRPIFLRHPNSTQLQELAERLPEATAPLLRQLEAGRAAANAQAASWAAAERALSHRASDAEARAASASEAARAFAERLQVCAPGCLRQFGELGCTWEAMLL